MRKDSSLLLYAECGPACAISHYTTMAPLWGKITPGLTIKGKCSSRQDVAVYDILNAHATLDHLIDRKDRVFGDASTTHRPQRPIQKPTKSYNISSEIHDLHMAASCYGELTGVNLAWAASRKKPSSNGKGL